ncbi:MAG: OmpA family protein [Verrucomicrobia bacterium]|nr:OmpA family protein [Verrucomicrobiota bacterium]
MAAGGGGSWKVAYADFVTAMMALFLVLWLTSQDQRIKEAVQRAFTNPFSSVTKASVGIIPTKDTQAVKSHEGNFDSASAVELSMLRRINEDLIKAIQTEPDEEEPIKLEMTPDGMRITVFDRARKPVFEAGTAQLTQYGTWVFSTVAWQIARYKAFIVELEGHTEAGFKPGRENYGVWELSADRALIARRKLLQSGVGDEQVREVHGFGDTMPMTGIDPADEKNRRVTVLLRVGSLKRK